jgi:hypothetical protein
VLDDPELTMMLQLYWSLNAELMFVITLAKLEAANIVKLVDE